MLLLFLLLPAFSQDIGLKQLDMSEHTANELSKYELVIFYATPYCHECMESIHDYIGKYKITNIGFVVIPTNFNIKSTFTTYKFMQQDIEKKFGISWQNVYFETSNNGVFSRLTINTGEESKFNECPAMLIIKDGKPVQFNSYRELFGSDDNGVLKNAFEKHFGKKKE